MSTLSDVTSVLTEIVLTEFIPKDVNVSFSVSFKYKNINIQRFK